ncbi:hypothetical protein OROMI_006673 [Orobanche minor]
MRVYKIMEGRNMSKIDDDDEVVMNVKRHYSQAEILKTVFDLGDCAYVKGPKRGTNYVGKILEFFEMMDGEDYFRVQWFFRAEDTVIKDDGRSHDKKRLFFSTLMNDNLLECMFQKLKLFKYLQTVDLKAKSIPPSDFYCDMKYSVNYSTFNTVVTGNHADDSSLSSLPHPLITSTKNKDETCKTETYCNKICKPELALLDMYSGYGGMSTGLCIGTKGSGIDLVTRWAVDLDEAACQSLKANHMEAQVRWFGYGPSDDTWEPNESLSKCQERIRDFVLKGMKAKILSCPGDVAVICGGPPCQGISGYNRFRNVDSPLDDEKNQQIVIFMDIIDFLRPKFVLMENVIDILRFANGCLGRYALSRLVRMHYQARLGITAAGCYGLPQFRLRVLLWGAHPHEVLHQFPLPTHDVVIQYGFPSDFERNVVAYDEGQSRDLEKIVVLSDAISDLPPVANDEKREKMSYKNAPETEFQKYIRAAKYGRPSKCMDLD